MTTPQNSTPSDLARWLDSQPDGPELARVWTLSALAEDAPASDELDAAWATFATRLAPGRPRAADRAARSQTHSAQRRVRYTTGVFAAVAFLFVAVLGWTFWAGQTLTVQAGADVLAVSLPDGSTASLRPGSELAYSRSFRSATVRLDGEAFFQGPHADDFAVETANASVTVLGTAFTVRSWTQDGVQAETAVVVAEGTVRLESRAGEAVTLEAGEESRVVGLARAPEPPSGADVVAALAWQTAAFSAYDASLADVAAQLSRQFQTPVRLGAGVDGTRRVTALLPRADSAEAVLDDLTDYLGYRYRSTTTGYEIVR